MVVAVVTVVVAVAPVVVAAGVVPAVSPQDASIRIKRRKVAKRNSVCFIAIFSLM